MRLLRPLLAACLLALSVPPAAADHEWAPDVYKPLQLQKPHLVSASPGDRFDVPVLARHRCSSASPVAGEAYFDVNRKGLPPGLNATIANATWGPCGVDGYAYARTALRLVLDASARAQDPGKAGCGAVGCVAFTVIYETPEKVSTAAAVLPVKIAYVAKAVVTGPKEGAVLPAQAVTLRFEVALTANAATLLRFDSDAPRSWRVEMPAGVSVSEAAGVQKVPWTVRVTPPVDGRGDRVITFQATPTDEATREEAGTAGTATWTGRLPPGSPEREPTQGASQAPPVVDRPPDEDDDEGVPVWAYGVVLAAGSVAALWWAVRPGGPR